MEPRDPSFETTRPSFETSTSTTDNPNWWTAEHTSRWDRMKEAFRRDWEQTKANFAEGSGRNLRQSATDTLKQAAGTVPVPPISQKTRPANRAEADQAQKKMQAASKKAAKDIAKAQDTIGNERAKLDGRTREANETLEAKRTELNDKLAKASDKAGDRMSEAQDEIDDAVVRRDSATTEWAQAEQEARYGFAARFQYPQYAQWDADLERTLSDEWSDLNPGRSWEDARAGIRRGWDFSEPQRH